MSQQTAREASPGRSRLGWMLRPYLSQLLLAVVLMVGLTGVNIIVPLLVGMVFDRVFQNHNWALLWIILSALLGLYITRNLLYFFSKYAAVQVGENVAFEVRNRLFERLQQMNLQYYRTNKPGQLSSRVMNDSFVIQTFIQDEVPKLLQAGLLFLGIIATMYAINWQLALASTIVLPLHLAAFHYFKRPIKAASRTAQEHMAEATGNLIEKFLGMEVIKGFTAEQRESAAFEHAIDASRQSQLRSKKFHVGQKVTADLLIGLGTIGLIGFGGQQVLSGGMEAGEFIAFFMFVKMLYPTVIDLMSGVAKLTKASAGADRVNEVLEAPTIEADGGDQRPEIQGKLVFDNVCFRYPENALVLRRTSFVVEPGEVCAIVGHSGAGKSTLVSLVPRFHDPESGHIYIDDIDARDLDLRHLRRAIGLAFQECFLFNSTILENLRYARPNADQREIVEVSRRTGAHDFIARLPHGYDTLVGEAGVTLSRGQKQLINLTRAMLKNPRILILDEATASIDEAREKQTVHAILEFMRGKTTLLITHRPELLRHADKVLELAEGEVIYFGPPQESPTMTESSLDYIPSPDNDFTHRPDRPEASEIDDDRPEARPSESGVWRGIKVMALSALVGLGTLAPTTTPTVFAQDQEQAEEQPEEQEPDAAEEDQTQWSGEEAAEENAEENEAAEDEQEDAPAEAEDASDDAAEAEEAPADDAQDAEADDAPADDDDAPAEPAEGDGGDNAEAADADAAEGNEAEDADNAADDEAAADEAAADEGADNADAADAEAADAAEAEAEVADAEAEDTEEEVELEGAGAGQFLPMEGVSDLEVQELLEIVVAQVRAQLGYEQVARAAAPHLPPAPSELRQVTALSRRAENTRHQLQFGYQGYVSQPAHLWLYGQSITGNQVSPNEDLAQVQELITQVREAQAARDEALTAADLAAHRVRLSYVGVGRALAVLKSFGYQTIEYKSGGNGVGKDEIIDPISDVDASQLPAVIALPGSKAVDLVGPAESSGGSFGLAMTPSVASDLPEATSAGREMELLILYDPAAPEQYSRVVERIQENIDLPAQQLLIEAMVLEVSETGLDKLGVDWSLSTPFSGTNTDNISDLQFGRLPDFTTRNNEEATLEVGIDDVFGHWRVQVEALVREGEAEILSRPSVLTLDNRQASIRVGEEIPVATSVAGINSGDKISFNFKYIPVGILLNVRPRISARAEEVSMQIDGAVSAQVPGEDLVVRDESGEELARAPRISTRRVQTYARVSNNTPFIIGGLISKDNTSQVDKVPLLGDIPILGHLFRTTQLNSLKREVIIVLTPYVLPENQVAGRNIPKDDDAFDSFGNELFRDAYRIRDEDVFDLTFLTQNPQVRRMQRLADRVVAQNRDLEDEYPFNRFAEGRIPGEHILVFRQMYEVINRNRIDQQLQNSQIIYFHPDEASESGFSVGFLEPTIQRLARQQWQEMNPGVSLRHAPEDPYKILQLAGKAVAISFTERQRAVHDGGILDQPVARIRVVDCANGQEWSRLLWEMNQPNGDGQAHYTVLVREQDNITRLKRALVLKRTVELNATRGSLTLSNFTVGRQLLMPSVDENKMYLIDSDAARYFFLTEQYYPALQKQLQEDIESLQQKLGQSAYSRYLGRGADEVEAED